MKLKRLTRPFEIKEVGDGGEISGYGSVFDVMDSYRDIVLPGAFKDTLAERKESGKGIPMLWQHWADEPVGIWTDFKEDKHGLYLEGEFVLDVQRAREAKALAAKGVVTGLSIGYSVPKGGQDYDKEKNINYLKQVDLWEVSPVTFPANDAAQIDSVRHKLAAGEVLDIREMEMLLRDVGLSQSAVKKLLAEGFSGLDHRDGGEDLGLLASLSNTLTRKLT
jgi:HK97 family phage prohead protease